MNFKDIRPFVRHAGQIRMSPGDESTENLILYDHCMLYVIYGSGTMTIGAELFTISKGSLIVLKPRIPYRFKKISEEISLITVNFDYTQENGETNCFYIKPDTAENFDPKKVTENIRFESEPEFNGTVYLSGAQYLEETMMSIYIKNKKKERFHDLYTSGKMLSVLAEAAREYSNSEYLFSKPDKTLEILRFINEHYNDDNLSNKSLGERFNFHPLYINQLIKNKTGYSVHKYIIIRRLSKAIELLEGTDIRISEIADNVGFGDVPHFSRYFKEYMGVSPRNYRLNIKNEKGVAKATTR